MKARRTYAEACGIARGLDAIGERWGLLVVRELLLGPKRFTDLQRDLPGPSPNVLSQRLRDLEAAGVVRRAVLPRPASARVYELTEWGRELEPALAELGRWGARSPEPIAQKMSRDAQVLGMSALFDPAAAGSLEGNFGLELDGEPYSLRIRGGRFTIRRGEAEDPVATLRTDRATLPGLLWRGVSLRSAVGAGHAEAHGDSRALASLLASFPAPMPVQAA